MPKLSAEQAANELDKALRGNRWYISTGVGETAEGEVLFVYTTGANHTKLKQIEKGWLGFKVLVRKTGRIRSLAHRRAFA
jgi:hypothetical protein